MAPPKELAFAPMSVQVSPLSLLISTTPPSKNVGPVLENSNWNLCEMLMVRGPAPTCTGGEAREMSLGSPLSGPNKRCAPGPTSMRCQFGTRPAIEADQGERGLSTSSVALVAKS